jgi:hypothetical protein
MLPAAAWAIGAPKLNTMAKAAHPESIESVSFFIFLPSFKNDRGQYSEECCSKKN